MDEWISQRVASDALITGTFVDVTSLAVVQELRPRFLPRALTYGLKDFDTASLKSAEQRLLTQEVSQYLWTRKRSDGSDYCDGIQFRSRHGDDLILWAIFEREDDGEISEHVSVLNTHRIAKEDPDLVIAMKILGITPYA